MQHVAKKIKCPLCGAKNAGDASRCSTCTRPLSTDTLPSQAVFQEALWAERIASKQSRAKTNPYVLLLAAIVIALVANYFWIGYGPDWAHVDQPLPKGSNWTEQRSRPEFRVDLPGTPMVATATDATGRSVTTSSVWLDSHWDLLRDENTRSTGGLLQSRRDLYAVTAVATTTDPGATDLRAAMSATIAAMAPGAVLGTTEVQQRQDPPYGEQFDLRAPYSDWPDAAGAGVVRARAIFLNGKVYVAATFFEQSEERALQDRLVRNFVPEGAPIELADAPTTTAPR